MTLLALKKVRVGVEPKARKRVVRSEALSAPTRASPLKARFVRVFLCTGPRPRGRGLLRLAVIERIVTIGSRA